MVDLKDHEGINAMVFNLTSNEDLDGVELIKNHPEKYEILNENVIQVPMKYLEYRKKPRQ